jgi:putative ATP-binding cassette transporter
MFSGLASGGASVALVGMVQALRHERYALSYLVACAVCFATKVLSATLVATLSQRAVADLRLHLCRQICAAPLRKLEVIGPARLHSILSNDISSFETGLFGVPGTVINAAIVSGCIIYLGYMAPLVTAAFIALLMVGLTIVAYLNGLASKRTTIGREVQNDLAQQVRLLADGIKELKLSKQRVARFFGALERSVLDARTHVTRAQVYFAVAASWAELLFFAIMGVLILAMGNHDRAYADWISTFTVTSLFMVVPLIIVLQSMADYVRLHAAIANVQAFGLDLDAEQVVKPEQDSTLSPDWARLSFSRVAYEYRSEQGDSFAIGPIDLEIRRGQCVFIIGGNGSGKTTLAKVLCGLYPPDSGEISIDGQRIGDSSLEAYRGLFSAVFADFCLFADLPVEPSTNGDDTVRGLLRRLDLANKVKVHDGVLSTVALSKGQQKRLALLSVLLERRPICLFDEWAADQDPVFKQDFYERILGELKAAGQTVIAVTHDDRYFAVADRILKLDEGKLTEMALDQDDAGKRTARTVARQGAT